MEDEIYSIEAVRLSEMIRKETEVTLIFNTGYQAHGVITDFDDDVIIVNVKGQEWMVYRSAVSTIVMGCFNGRK